MLTPARADQCWRCRRVNTITSHLGEIVAPFVFFLLTRGDSLTPAFAVGALATVPQVVLPRMIRASGKPEGKAADAPVDMRSRCTAVMEGLSFIIHHPLLPGLYGAPRPSRPCQRYLTLRSVGLGHDGGLILP